MQIGDNNSIRNYGNKISNYYTKEAGSALMFDDYMKKILPRMYNAMKPTYPQIVKIPKSIDEMLAGDFSPAREIVVDKVETWEGVPIWFGCTAKGVDVKLGYENGDSRYDCTVNLSDPEPKEGKGVHMLLAGATGMGKSVTVNDIIFGMALEYAPWELKLTLSDAKIVEFKRYALGDKLPHVESIAATGDVDYLISVVKSKYEEMKRMQSVFAKAGCQNLKDFRKKTGLYIPRNVLVFDEFQTMFANAGKRISELNFYIDQFGRLGRNAGYHLILCSQELGSDIQKNTLNQIKVRASLGCSGNVSEQILGNDEARTIQQKGRLITNLFADEPDNKIYNTLHRVPFQPENQFIAQSKFLKDLGNKYKFSYTLTFYDEEDVVREKDYLKFINKFGRNNHMICLGEPSYVIRDKDKVVKLQLTGNDIENFLILNQDKKHLIRYTKMLVYNFLLNKGSIDNVVLDGNPELTKHTGLDKIAISFTKIKSAKDTMLEVCYVSIYNRMLLLEVDDKVFSKMQFSEVGDKIFRMLVNEGAIADTEINRGRTAYMQNLILADEYIDKVGLGGFRGEELEKKIIGKIRALFASYKKWGAENVRLTRDMLPTTYFWIMGLNRIQQLGTAPKSKDIARLKQALLDCSEFNIRFVLVSTTLEDLTDLVPGIRFALLDATPTTEQTKLKCSDAYPKTLPQVLGILYDNMIKECFKFKKMIFDKELIG